MELKFTSAAFYSDKGVKQTHRKTLRTRNAKKKTVIMILPSIAAAGTRTLWQRGPSSPPSASG